MSVHKTSYRPYSGPLTPARWRFLILPRYAWQQVFSSRLLVAFFAGCFVFPAGLAVAIYLRHNLAALAVLQISAKDLPAVSANIYLPFMVFQSTLAFLLTAFVAPGLIAADLANNGLPLYLSRPFSRGEYVLGKMWVLLGLQSLITWVPGLLLILLQGSLEGNGWFTEHWRYPFAIFCGFWIWILLVSLIGLALSAWVKWRLAAAALLLGVFFVTSGFGAAINVILETKWGDLLILVEQFRTVWLWLFGLPIPEARTPITSAWAVLIGVCVLCLELLGRKLRAYEVVK